MSSFVLQLTLPFIWAFAFVFWRCVLALYRWAVHGVKESVRHFIMGVKNTVITNTISLLIVVYHSICLKCFQVRTPTCPQPSNSRDKCCTFSLN